jgi:hypothetical protein
MAGTNSREQNYWPGFVDALTNVILILVFVVVIFALSVFYFTAKLAQSEIGRKVLVARNAYQVNLEAKVTASEEKIKALNQRIAELEAERNRVVRPSQPPTGTPLLKAPVELKADKNASIGGGEPGGIPVTIANNANAIIVSFAPGVSEIDKKIHEAINTAIGSYSESERWRVELIAEATEESFSEGRRLGFYRIAVIRNYLVSKGVNPANVETVIRQASGGNNERSRVLIRIRK